ncbi:hypothetical protein AB0D33_17880 [Streptomyces sp. NPDC048404]|uniref:hypothetical protein n=1 Tax=unclassified Streptomyces TaxID=2593676 RepID=UPI00342099B3
MADEEPGDTSDHMARPAPAVPGVPGPRLPPGPRRRLRQRLRDLHRAAGTPAPAVLAARAAAADDPAQDQADTGATREQVAQVLSGTPTAVLRTTLSVTAALARMAGEDQHAAVADVQALWRQMEHEPANGLRTAAQWDPVRLGVRPAPGPDGAGDLPLTEYLTRPHDATLRRRLSRAASTNDAVFVLLVGRSASGKTRAAYEAVADVLPDWPVLFPADADELLTWIDARDIDPRTVLWLNETQDYLTGAAGERAAHALVRLLQQVAPLAVVGTLWPEHLRRMTDRNAGAGEQSPQVRALLTGRHTMIEVPDTLAGPAEDLAQAAARDPRMAAAVRAAGTGRRVLQHLTAGPELVRHWDMGPDHWFSAPEHAVLTAAVEARRLGHAAAVPTRLLMDAAVGFMDSTARARAGEGEDWFAAAISTLTRTADGSRALIAHRHEPGVGAPDSYRPDDYLEQHVRRVRAHQTPPAAFWHAARWAHTADDVCALARAAEHRRRYSAAAALYAHAVERGDEGARAALAVLRQTTGDLTAAEEIAATDPAAWAALAVARENSDDPDGSCRAYRRAAELGDGWAWAALARQRETAGDSAAADAVAAEAAQAGHAVAWRTLGRMRAAHAPQALHAYERAVHAGDPWGHMGLAHAAERAGDLPAAVRHATRATEAEITAAWAVLVRLRWARGEPAAALEAAVAGAQSAGAEGFTVLARLRHRAGDRSGAAAAHREAAALGAGAAWRDLARLAEEDGDSTTAEEAAAQAARVGDADAWTALAESRRNAGDDAGAAHAAAEAARAGDSDAWIMLARGREQAGHPDAAETAADRAADHGSPQAWSALSRIRERAGDRDGSRRAAERAFALGALETWTALGREREQRADPGGAERAYRRGAEAGDTDAHAALGALYTEAGRTAEARAAYRIAVDAGHLDAWEGLLSVLAAQAPRAASAQMATRLRRTGLPAED